MAPLSIKVSQATKSGSMNQDGISNEELQPYDLTDKDLTQRIRSVRTKLDSCRDERELLDDYHRYAEQLHQLELAKQQNSAERAEYIRMNRLFDRELEQYKLEDQRLAIEIFNRQKTVEAEGLPPTDGELIDIIRIRNELDRHRIRYLRDRDHLAAKESTDGKVMPGSIVTVRTSRGRRYTFVLTARSKDVDYPTEAYSSRLGDAVRFKRVGDRVLNNGHHYTEIERIEPGFRVN